MKINTKYTGAALTLAALRKARDLIDKNVERYPRKHGGPHLIDKQLNACIICWKYLGETEER